MDARERYDPEDLEALLSERGFDELLDEERAFVLRHVRDRAEYEALRATLSRVRTDRRPGPPLSADPAVRERVLEAFRAAHRPGWRIWLNSVGDWLFPQRPLYYWRPALALGVLALLITAGITMLSPGIGASTDGLAELKAPGGVPPPAPPPAMERQEQAAAPPVNEALPVVPPEMKTIMVEDAPLTAVQEQVAAAPSQVAEAARQPTEESATGLAASPAKMEQSDDAAGAYTMEEDRGREEVEAMERPVSVAAGSVVREGTMRASRSLEQPRLSGANADLSSLMRSAW